MLQEEIIEPANTDWASAIVLAPEMDRPLIFCDDYYGSNEITFSVSYLPQQWKNVSMPLEKRVPSQHLISTHGTDKSKLVCAIDPRRRLRFITHYAICCEGLWSEKLTSKNPASKVNHIIVSTMTVSLGVPFRYHSLLNERQRPHATLATNTEFPAICRSHHQVKGMSSFRRKINYKDHVLRSRRLDPPEVTSAAVQELAFAAMESCLRSFLEFITYSTVLFQTSPRRRTAE